MEELATTYVQGKVANVSTISQSDWDGNASYTSLKLDLVTAPDGAAQSCSVSARENLISCN